MKIARTPPDEFHRKMAVACDKAAWGYASELSGAKDPVTHQRLSKKVQQQKEQAEFHRQKAAELSEPQSK